MQMRVKPQPDIAFDAVENFRLRVVRGYQREDAASCVALLNNSLQETPCLAQIKETIVSDKPRPDVSRAGLLTNKLKVIRY